MNAGMQSLIIFSDTGHMSSEWRKPAGSMEERFKDGATEILTGSVLRTLENSSTRVFVTLPGTPQRYCAASSETTTLKLWQVGR